MRRFNAFVLDWVAILLIVGCSPKIISTPAPVPQPAPAPVAQPAAPAPTTNPKDAAWAKVVETAQKEGRVTLYANTFTGDRSIALTQAFKQKYGITAEILLGRGAEFIERLKTERRTGSITGDIFEGAATHIGNAKLAGLMLNPKDLPVLLEPKDNYVVHPYAVDSEGYSLAYTQRYNGPTINTNLVKSGQEPKSFGDLLNTKWKGKLIVYDPRISTGLYNLFVPLMNVKALDWDYIKQLGKQEPALATSGPQASQMLARGEYPVNVFDNVLASGPFVDEGAPIKAIDMSEGVVRNVSVVGFIRDSPHPNAAKLFTNWLLSQEGQMVFGKSSGMNGVRKELPDFEPEAFRLRPKNPVILMPSDNDMITDMFRDKAWVPFFGK